MQTQGCLLALAALLAFGRADGRVFYVESSGGASTNVWRSLAEVNAAALAPGDKVLFQRGGVWRGTLVPRSGVPGACVRYGAYGEGPKPVLEPSLSRDVRGDWTELQPGLWSTPVADPDDIGNVIFNHGEACGFKKWRLSELTAELDFWHDRSGQRLVIRHGGHPVASYASIEFAPARFAINMEGCHDAIFEDLAIRYAGAHGFGGGSTAGITIRGCDVSWIGGSFQRLNPDGSPLRYGNGIEFWMNASNNLVEGCRLWEIYDAALSNQGRGYKPGTSDQIDITYRDNVIWNAEYAFEYWNGPADAKTSRVIFEHNTCVGAGFGWSHRQRPNPYGVLFLSFKNNAVTEGVVVRNNVFCFAKAYAVRLMNDWRPGLQLDHNLYFVTGSLFAGMGDVFYEISDFRTYQQATGFDAHSLFAEPCFVNPAAHDYRLQPDSPGTRLATDGGSVGKLKAKN